ncbi:hypothetical protein HK405_006779 [Cladochytrium tenue]|nr:hypothetical protein HK405_006779 [Cladochytrium tenue]
MLARLRPTTTTTTAARAATAAIAGAPARLAPAALLVSSRRTIVNITSMYAAEVVASGKGRDGAVRGSEGFEAKMAMPKALGGPGNSATVQNPEIFFAAGYSSCFLSALHAVAGRQKLVLPKETAVRCRAHIGKIEGTGGGGFGLAVELFVTMPGVEAETANKILEAAHQVWCDLGGRVWIVSNLSEVRLL